MTASQLAKSMGFSSLTQVADRFGTSTDTLNRWYKQDQAKVHAIILGFLIQDVVKCVDTAVQCGTMKTNKKR